MPYLEQRGPIGQDNYVFVYNRKSKKGWPVTSRQVYRVFKDYLEKAGLPKERTIHGMRHRRITTWLEDGFLLKEGQLMAGHSSASVTEGYTHLVGKNLLEKQREIERRE
ncbi:tyrosine-type recombinase/integrase [Aliifodinibius sp. S!AR15-10]|uniref:tyrosine-type recombinase/integrase n=1 Tax=Aliifodinibius sp. S!AR15-10 TaxID=2950437 RepID=UPI0038F5D7FA